MAITVRGTSVIGSSSATSRTLTAVSGNTANDVGIAVVAYNSITGTITPPAGWVTLWDDAAGFGVRSACYRRVMVGGEVSWTWTFSAAASSFLLLTNFVGVNTTIPEDAPAGVVDKSANATSRSAFLPGGVITEAPDALLLCMFPTAGINSITASWESSMTSIYNTSTTSFACVAMAYEQLTHARATGARRIIGSKAGYSVSRLLALRPATYTGAQAPVRKLRNGANWGTASHKVWDGTSWQV